MATMNIGNIKDDFYRYKMPRLQTKVEGRGNGIKTVITNMTAIARSLVRDPAYPTKYFGCELGTQAKYDPKTEKAVVNGNHSQEDLLKLLSSYIDKFVLCGTCKNPETSYRIDKKDNIFMECKACGATTHVPPTEKLCTFILKNPPKASPKERGATAQATAKVSVPENIPTVSSNVDEDDWGTEETSKAAAKARRKKLREEGKNVVKDMGELSLEDKAQEKAEVEASESEDDRPNPVEVLKTFLQKKPDASDEAISRIVSKLAEDYEFDNKKVVCLLFESLFDKEIVKQVPKRAPLFEKYVDSEAEQKVIIGYVELFFGQQNPDLIKSVPVALKAFYDADLLEEEVIVEWFDSKKKSRFLKDKDALKKVKEAAKVFVEWLKNAEEEDSDEDDEESSGSDE